MDPFKLYFVLCILIAYILVYVFDCVDTILKRHIAQKHPGVNECSEQDPSAAECS